MALPSDQPDQPQTAESPLETVTALLIAVVVVIGALIAWQASRVDDSAGDADYAGLHALTTAEQTRALHLIRAYEDYGLYLNYWRNNLLSEEVAARLDGASPEEMPALEQEYKTSVNLADVNMGYFEARYLNRDGSYNLQRQLGEMWSDAGREMDLGYEAQFAEADALRGKTLKLLLALMVLTIAPVFYSLVEAVDGRQRYLMVALGTLFAIAGLVLAGLAGFNML